MQSPFWPTIPMESDRDLYLTYLDYILHRFGHQLTEAQCGAKLGHDALALQSQLNHAPHDTDSMRNHIIRTVETLLLTVNNTGITKFYCPHLLIAHLKEDPQILNHTLSNLIQQILTHLTHKQEGSRIDNMANLLEKVDCFIEAALKCGQFTNFDHLATPAGHGVPQLLAQPSRAADQLHHHPTRLPIPVGTAINLPTEVRAGQQQGQPAVQAHQGPWFP